MEALEIFRTKLHSKLNTKLLIDHYEHFNLKEDTIDVHIPLYSYYFVCYDVSSKILHGYSVDDFVNEFVTNFKKCVLNSIFRKK